MKKISLEKITLEFKGVKIHLKPVRHGVVVFDAPNHSIESPNQYVDVEFETSAGNAETSMKYALEIEGYSEHLGFIEYVGDALRRVRLPAPNATPEEEKRILSEMNEIYLFLFKKGYTTFDSLRTDYLFEKEN